MDDVHQCFHQQLKEAVDKGDLAAVTMCVRDEVRVATSLTLDSDSASFELKRKWIAAQHPMSANVDKACKLRTKYFQELEREEWDRVATAPAPSRRQLFFPAKQELGVQRGRGAGRGTLPMCYQCGKTGHMRSNCPRTLAMVATPVKPPGPPPA